MLRLAGALALILGCAGFGWCICQDAENRIRQLGTLARAFDMLESEVSYSRATLPEGLERVGKKLGGSLGECLAEIGKGVKTEQGQGAGMTLDAVWRKEIPVWLQETCLDRREKELISSFPEYTGYTDGKMQAQNLERFGREMKKAEEEAAKEAEGRKKAVLSVSMACGLLTVILLL